MNRKPLLGVLKGHIVSAVPVTAVVLLPDHDDCTNREANKETMANNQQRYDGNPLLRLLELWVQWAIGEIDPQDISRLMAMEPSLRNTWKLNGTWHEMIEALLELKPSMKNELRAMWHRNLETAKEQAVVPPVEMFSQSIADQMIGSR